MRAFCVANFLPYIKVQKIFSKHYIFKLCFSWARLYCNLLEFSGSISLWAFEGCFVGVLWILNAFSLDICPPFSLIIHFFCQSIYLWRSALQKKCCPLNSSPKQCFVDINLILGIVPRLRCLQILFGKITQAQTGWTDLDCNYLF